MGNEMKARTAGFVLYMIGCIILQLGTAIIWLAPNDG